MQKPERESARHKCILLWAPFSKSNAGIKKATGWQALFPSSYFHMYLGLQKLPAQLTYKHAP